jgi:hypothetical protein
MGPLLLPGTDASILKTSEPLAYVTNAVALGGGKNASADAFFYIKTIHPRKT